jgi:hypothetical protein
MSRCKFSHVEEDEAVDPCNGNETKMYLETAIAALVVSLNFHKTFRKLSPDSQANSALLLFFSPPENALKIPSLLAARIWNDDAFFRSEREERRKGNYDSCGLASSCSLSGNGSGEDPCENIVHISNARPRQAAFYFILCYFLATCFKMA